MERIAELRRICQEQMRGADVWQDKLVCRRFSIYITWLLLHTRVRAMQASWFFFVFFLVPALLFAYGRFLSAAIALQIWYILDGVDGEIARYRKETSLGGAYLDRMAHYISHSLLFISIGIGLIVDCGNIFYFFCSLSAAMSMVFIPATDDLKNLVFTEAAVSTDPGCASNSRAAEKRSSIFKRLFILLHKVCTFPTAMNLITASALIKAFTPIGAVKPLVLFYGFFSPFVWIGRLYVNTQKGTLLK